MCTVVICTKNIVGATSKKRLQFLFWYKDDNELPLLPLLLRTTQTFLPHPHLFPKLGNTFTTNYADRHSNLNSDGPPRTLFLNPITDPKTFLFFLGIGCNMHPSATKTDSNYAISDVLHKRKYNENHIFAWVSEECVSKTPNLADQV